MNLYPTMIIQKENSTSYFCLYPFSVPAISNASTISIFLPKNPLAKNFDMPQNEHRKLDSSIKLIKLVLALNSILHIEVHTSESYLKLTTDLHLIEASNQLSLDQIQRQHLIIRRSPYQIRYEPERVLIETHQLIKIQI